MNGDGGCSFWQPIQADSQPKSSGLFLGRRPLGAILHLSNEPDSNAKSLLVKVRCLGRGLHCLSTV